MLNISCTEKFEGKLQRRDEQGNGRSLRTLGSMVDFFSNDYLGYGRSELLQKKVAQALQNSSLLGGTGSRLLSGHNEVVEELEYKLAEVLSAETALLFSSGYTLNIGLPQALTDEDDFILCDVSVHASIKNGCRLSRAKTFYFRHNDLSHLEQKLKRLALLRKSNSLVFVFVESLYSMDGDEVSLYDLVSLCRSFDAQVVIDEAHSLGTDKNHKLGMSIGFGLHEDIFARVYPFGKALGFSGAVVVGNHLLKKLLINFCHSFIYSTALPFSVLTTIKEIWEYFLKENESFFQLQENLSFFYKELNEQTVCQGPIYIHRFKDIETLKACSLYLKEKNFAVAPIYSPTVRKGCERLRISIHAHNTCDEMRELVQMMKGTTQ